MLKGNDLVGMAIVAYDTGEEIHQIKDLIFDINSNFLGFLVEENRWLKHTKVLPLHGIKVIGADVIIASSQSVIVKAEQVPEIREVLTRNMVLDGTKIVTEEGRNLGTIVDLYFDKQTGAIEGYEVYGGIFADFSGGRSFVPAPQNLKLGDDVAFVPPAIADMMVERVINPSQALQSVSGNGASSLSINNEQKVSASNPGKGTFAVAQNQQLPSGGQKPESQNLARENSLSLYQVEQTLGRRVLSSVKTSEGLYVAALGQIITEKVIARSRFYDKEQELIAAVYLNSPQNITELPTTNTLLSKKHRSGLGEQIKNTFKELKRRNDIIVEKWRIKRAVGRSVNRVIFDKQDNVILNVGELISYQTIERARKAGVIDILLTSV